MGIHNDTHKDSATAIKNRGAYISLHTSAIATEVTGADEASGVTRKLTTWGGGAWSSALNRHVFTGTEVNIPCAAATYAGGGIWSALTAGNFVASSPFSTGPVIVSGTGGSIDVTPAVMA